MARNEIDWARFRQLHIKNSGDPIYACWALLYKEDCVSEVKSMQEKMGLIPMITSNGICPVAEQLQPRLLQFTTNQNLFEEMEIQAEALSKTLRHFA